MFRVFLKKVKCNKTFDSKDNLLEIDLVDARMANLVVAASGECIFQGLLAWIVLKQVATGLP